MRIRKVVKIEDLNAKMGINRGYLRMKVGLRMDRPLLEGFWVLMKEKSRIWAAIRYEKLSDFCYRCG